ncbi:MAG: Gfo/Idh/MocA family oxidoreductase [Verrucomicrobia bacterium]|nr:Gfo/Idh/MocA family oxidoreductase [Verrucomicrobiota bacterium]
MPTQNHSTGSKLSGLTRRRFIASAGATALAFNIVNPTAARGASANSALTLGLIGCGGRGSWIADLFRKHGGYRVVAVADYFQDRVDACGEKFEVPAANRYTGLMGYRRLLEQPLDMVVIKTPPYFHPEQAAAAVDAGRHVYLAKPVAVDVPGCQSIAESGRKATSKQRCFLVDFQTRANASYQEVVRRVRAGQIGRIVSGEATYFCGPTFERANEELKRDPRNPELRLRAWGLDRVLSGDVITEQNIHALDVASWILDAAPVRAYGTGGAARGYAGTCWDHFAVVYYYPNDVLLSFSSKQFGHGYDDILCRVYGTEGTVDTHYFGAVTLKGKEDGFNGGVMQNLYTEGTVNNIAEFHRCVTQGDWSNPTVPASVQSNLTTILGRTAAYERREITWDEMMRKSEKWEAGLEGAKA